MPARPLHSHPRQQVLNEFMPLVDGSTSDSGATSPVKSSRHYLLVWEFHVRRGCEAEFDVIYGRKGAWAQLFARAAGFVKTELNRDLNNPRRYLTFDYWVSKEAYETFREQFRNEYAELDQRCQGLTEREIALGAFESANE